MIDPLFSLTFSMHANKGVYALLVGSGVSRAAGIPTGYEITLDLIRKLAVAQGEDAEADPEGWYSEKYGRAPDYSELLNAVAKLPAERNQVLKAYFEPPEREPDDTSKRPTDAHRAIAELVVGGHVRIIVTTNFDRLIERAVEEAGVTPTVISTPDAVDGALPLIHSEVVVIKVHGDYLDTRIKNTQTELEKYDSRLDVLLDRVFDEFGLIVCGWSADWDPALRAALERCKSRRFTTYWCVRGKPEDAARRLMELRGSELIPITDADIFFRGLAEKVSALSEYDRPHPLSAKLAVTALKNYLSDDRYTIKLHDLILAETESLYQELKSEDFKPSNSKDSRADFLRLIGRYEAITEKLQAMFIVGSYWCRDDQIELWRASLERIANPPREVGVMGAVDLLYRYPGLILLYSGGIAALAGGKYRLFVALLNQVKLQFQTKDVVAGLYLYPEHVIQKHVGQNLPGQENKRTPVSNHLFGQCREPLRELISDDRKYEQAFDRYEYMYALVHADLYNVNWGPYGCFAWRSRGSYEGSILKQIEREAAAAGENWPFLQAGLFNGSFERFEEIRKSFFAKLEKSEIWF